MVCERWILGERKGKEFALKRIPPRPFQEQPQKSRIQFSGAFFHETKKNNQNWFYRPRRKHRNYLMMIIGTKGPWFLYGRKKEKSISSRGRYTKKANESCTVIPHIWLKKIHRISRLRPSSKLATFCFHLDFLLPRSPISLFFLHFLRETPNSGVSERKKTSPLASVTLLISGF